MSSSLIPRVVYGLSWLIASWVTLWFASPLVAGDLAPLRAGQRVAQAANTPEQAPARQEDALPLPPVTVTAPPPEAYTVPNATTATKTDTPIIETPVSIQVVPQQILEDQQTIRVEQAIKNVSGVYRTNFFMGQATDEFIIRGFPTLRTYRDGTLNDFSLLGQQDLANIERLEVLKGPASILYGRIEPGGLVNLVTKKPLSSPFYALEQQFGSFDFYRTTADATGPITPDKALRYRFTLAYENAGSFRDFIQNERLFLAPVVQWQITDRTQVTVGFDVLWRDDTPDLGLPPLADGPPPVPRSRNLGEPADFMRSTRYTITTDVSHAFNAQWSLRQRFTALFGEEEDVSTFVDSGINDDGRTADRFVGPQRDKLHTYSVQLDVTGKFSTWGIRHTVLLGGDYYYRRDRNFVTPLSLDTTAPSIDIFDPVYGRPAFSPRDATERFQTTDEWFGLYLQDQLTLPYHIHLLAGFRYDNATSRATVTPDASFGAPFDTQNDRVTPRVGLLWQPLPELAVYGSYAENFGLANTGITRQRNPLPPETAQQWEVGLKASLFGGRFSGTLAYYTLTKQNISAPDPDPELAERGFAVAVGEARSRGVELDLAGELLPGWQLIMAYAYTDTEILSDNDLGSAGNRLPQVPLNGGSLWTTYEFQDGWWRGLIVGGGVVGRGTRQGDFENTFQLPGYVTGDLMAGYTLSLGKARLSAQLNVSNLSNEEYIASSGSFRGRINPGAPRSFLGMIRAEY